MCYQSVIYLTPEITLYYKLEPEPNFISLLIEMKILVVVIIALAASGNSVPAEKEIDRDFGENAKMIIDMAMKYVNCSLQEDFVSYYFPLPIMPGDHLNRFEKYREDFM